MLQLRTEARRGLRWGLLGLASAIALTALPSDPAEAAARHKRPQIITDRPGYAAIVLDVNSGSVLHQASADETRHPASLTKIMTLLMLFERLESGRLTLESVLRVSEFAASQPPTRLGLREGTTITVEEAIKGMITKSANDAAVVVAENLAGSEAEFARQMTRKARALGMSKTVYRNASGLPDSEQVTTARDQAILGRVIQERYPRYYRYFATRSFTFRGRRIGNHNRLLGRIEGVDGIKTGYTRASGFNLVTSMRRGNRHIVAVVLGGPSAGARDARMVQLINRNIEIASTRKTAPAIAETQVAESPARPEPKSAARFEPASAKSSPVRVAASSAPRSEPAAGSAEPIRPVAVKTVPVRPGPSAKSQATVVPPMPLPSVAAKAEPKVETAAAADPLPAPARAGVLGFLPARTATASVTEPVTQPLDAPARSPASPAAKRPSRAGGWIIQVGAYPAEAEAQQQLASARSKAQRLLRAAEAFTEPVQRGDATLYRARFAGLDRTQAEAACRLLRQNDVACLAIRN